MKLYLKRKRFYLTPGNMGIYCPNRGLGEKLSPFDQDVRLICFDTRARIRGIKGIADKDRFLLNS